MNMSKAHKTNLLLEENRLKTFTHWIHSNNKKCNAAKMAEAGFYFTGNSKERDSAQCFLCNKALDGWESDDDPWEEHKKHTSDCLFANIGKAEIHLTVSQYIDVGCLYAQKIVSESFDKEIKKLKEKLNSVENGSEE